MRASVPVTAESVADIEVLASPMELQRPSTVPTPDDAAWIAEGRIVLDNEAAARIVGSSFEEIGTLTRVAAAGRHGAIVFFWIAGQADVIDLF